MSEYQTAKPGLYARLSTALLRLLPQHALSGLMYRLARSQVGWLKNAIIRFVVRRFGVDLSLAKNPDALSYPSFNAFFTRELRPEVRPLAEHGLLSPVDGKVSQCGAISNDRLIQAKGHDFSLNALLGDTNGVAKPFLNGQFATIYLSPKDYHRIHMPCDAVLREMVFVPGDLFSVSEETAQLVPGLFARNERVICHFDTEFGPLAMVLVGAIFVGSMQTVWHGEVRAPGKQPTHWRYPATSARRFARGEEMARFNMGSTVILLLPPESLCFSDQLTGSPVVMGQCIAQPCEA